MVEARISNKDLLPRLIEVLNPLQHEELDEIKLVFEEPNPPEDLKLFIEYTELVLSELPDQELVEPARVVINTIFSRPDFFDPSSIDSEPGRVSSVKRGKPSSPQGMLRPREFLRYATSMGFDYSTGNGRHAVHLIAPNGRRKPVPFHGNRTLSRQMQTELMSFIEEHGQNNYS